MSPSLVLLPLACSLAALAPSAHAGARRRHHVGQAPVKYAAVSPPPSSTMCSLWIQTRTAPANDRDGGDVRTASSAPTAGGPPPVCANGSTHRRRVDRGSERGR